MRTASKLLALGLLSGKSIFPFGDSFTRGDGPIQGGWSGATWTISGGTAINTPVLGSELIANGGFAADTDWTKEDGWTISAGAAHKGESDASNRKISQDVLTANKWYRCVYTVTSLVDGAARPYFNASYVQGGTLVDGTITASMFATGATAGILGSATTTTMDLDNVSFKEIPLANLFLARSFGVNSVNASAALTLLTGNPAGIALCLDSVSSPTNYVIATHDGVTTVNIHKCVAGTISLVNSAAGVAYSAGARIGLRRSGTTFTASYDSVDATSGTVSDASIISNTYHGLFSTHPTNTLDDVTVASA